MARHRHALLVLPAVLALGACVRETSSPDVRLLKQAASLLPDSATCPEDAFVDVNVLANDSNFNGVPTPQVW